MALSDNIIPKIIGEIVAVAAKQFKASADEKEFIGDLYAGATVDDLEQYERAELAGTGVTAFKFLSQHKPGTSKVRVSNPSVTARSDFGLEAPVTAIELVNDNMPFLVDSVMGEMQERGYRIHLVLHPIIETKRAPSGNRSKAASAEAVRESCILIHIDRIESSAERKDLTESLEKILADVRIVVADWRRMMGRLDNAVDAFQTNPPPIPVEEIAEGMHFLRWLIDENFTFLGMREYTFDPSDPESRFESVKGTGLGILRDSNLEVLRRGRELVSFTPELREFLMQPVPLIVTKANVRSLVHRRTHMDYIGVKMFTDQGKLAGELRIVGLFTSTAYTRSTRNIPFLRRKVDYVLRATGHEADSHTGKALQNILEQYPRDELFQIDPAILAGFALAVQNLNEHPRIRALARVDRFDRFVSVLVFVPKDRFSTEVREEIGQYLATVFDGRVSAFYPTFPDGALARVHYIIGRYQGETPKPAQAQLEADIAGIVRDWDDRLYAALASEADLSKLNERRKRYTGAFSGAYQEAFGAGQAVRDIEVMERLAGTTSIEVVFEDRNPDGAQTPGLKLYSPDNPIALTERVPVLENMGFDVISERSYVINPREGGHVSLHEMALEVHDGKAFDLDKCGALLEDCFKAIWTGQAENDGYIGLVLRAGLSWNQVSILQAYSRYLRQVRIPFSQDYMWSTLNRHPRIAANLVALFEARFSTDAKTDAKARKKAADRISANIRKALESVESLDEDRIVRRFMNLIMVTLRTNFWQRDETGTRRETLSLKLDSRAVDDLPAPRPYREIFVFSPRVEGVHMRFGAVARGGLRWSDRPQDFRTEILGLVKAQQVKNAVIVPVGSKGGFVPKLMPANPGREEFMAEGIATYKLFIGSMLDITDNLDGDKVIPPVNVVRHDGDDPYLVVAADKGTAAFSDIANGLADDRGFWLSDAFASGGSVGYDHKKMGITARGGWEAVKRHFREIDHDVQSEPVTVVGVGDMSGDVFGNGMLLSEKIKLLGAFDHRDIFIDPDPDPAKSFKERKRLFELERSSWQDYNKKLISKGGGVFSRRDKSIPLSTEMQNLLDLKKANAAPNEIINAILKVEADLLWFGGIGTYVRATSESDDDVGDRASDAVRVTAKELRVKAIGEGANLGATQKARIEFASLGGRINTDAIDNSAGVNSSDLEVNIKIALGNALRDNRLKMPARNKLLASMTADVAQLVLRNNYLQTLSVSLAERRGMDEFGFQVRLMQDLESRNLLDRQVEDLPDDLSLMEREAANEPLTRPELAVLLAYAKITLYDEMLASSVPDDDYLAKELMRYFPQALQKNYAGDIASHRLRREIVATMLANSMINRGGPTLISRLVDQTGADVGEISAAYAVVRDSFQMGELNSELDKLDNRISGMQQLDLYMAVQTLMRNQMVWFLRNAPLEDGIGALVERFGKGIKAVRTNMSSFLPKDRVADLKNRQADLEAQGVPASLAGWLASLDVLNTASDIVLISERAKRSVEDVAKVFFNLAEFFGTDQMIILSRQLDVPDYFDRLALNRSLDLMSEGLRQITVQVLKTGKTGQAAIDVWRKSRAKDVERTRQGLSDIVGGGEPSLSRLSVGASLLGDLVRG